MKQSRFCIYCGVEVGKWKRACGPCKAERRRAWARDYYHANKERIEALRRERHAKRPGALAEYQRRWREKNPDYKLRRVLRKHGLIRKDAA